MSSRGSRPPSARAGRAPASRSLSSRRQPAEGGHHGLLTGHLLGAALAVEDAEPRLGGVLDPAAGVLEELARELHVAGGDLHPAGLEPRVDHPADGELEPRLDAMRYLLRQIVLHAGLPRRRHAAGARIASALPARAARRNAVGADTVCRAWHIAWARPVSVDTAAGE